MLLMLMLRSAKSKTMIKLFYKKQKLLAHHNPCGLKLQIKAVESHVLFAPFFCFVLPLNPM